MRKPKRLDVLDALAGREASDDATPDEQMREVLAWNLGDPGWWDLIKAWMDDVGYRAPVAP